MPLKVELSIMDGIVCAEGYESGKNEGESSMSTKFILKSRFKWDEPDPYQYLLWRELIDK